MIILSLCATLAFFQPFLQDPPPDTGAAALISEAWQHLPAYDGVPRPFLSEDVRRDTTAATQLLESALELHPGHMRALWSLGHAESLLAEDQRNRGAGDAATAHNERAVAALSEAIARNPDDPWSYLCRGETRMRFGSYLEASQDFEAAVKTADAILVRPGVLKSISWLRRRALEGQTEALMRLGEFDAARTALRDFHAEFSTNERELLLAIGESHLRQGDFAGAREIYVATCEQFPNDVDARTLLGLVEGLLGDREAATSHLTEALAHEPSPAISTRRWLWILSTPEQEAAARDEVAGFLEQQPDGVTEWELAVTRFVLGESEVDAFADATRTEELRRMAAGQATDEQMCEAWFHAGLRWEREAAASTDVTAKEATLLRAREAHSAALAYTPASWNWERTYAALRLEALRGEALRGEEY